MPNGVFHQVTTAQQDLLALQKIARQTFTETFGSDNSSENLEAYLDDAYSLSTLRSELESSASQTFFYKIGDQVAAYLKVNWNDAQTENDYPDALEIQRIYVLKSFQKEHIGGQLMKKALSIAKSLNKSDVWLGVWENNFNAQGFYAHYGFKRISQHTFTVGDDQQTDFILSKRL